MLASAFLPRPEDGAAPAATASPPVSLKRTRTPPAFFLFFSFCFLLSFRVMFTPSTCRENRTAFSITALKRKRFIAPEVGMHDTQGPGFTKFPHKSQKPGLPTRADLGGRSVKVGVGVTGRTPSWPRRRMFFPQVGALGNSGGLDHPSPWRNSEDSGITDRLWPQKASSENQPVRKRS